MNISPNVVILTREELKTQCDEFFLKGVRRGRFEERSDQSRAKATEGKAGMAAGTASVRQSTAGTGLQVGEASADLPATSEFMDVTAGETAPSPAPVGDVREALDSVGMFFRVLRGSSYVSDAVSLNVTNADYKKAREGFDTIKAALTAGEKAGAVATGPTIDDAAIVAGRLRGLGVKRWREYGELEHKDVLEALRLVWLKAPPTPATSRAREALTFVRPFFDLDCPDALALDCLNRIDVALQALGGSHE